MGGPSAGPYPGRTYAVRPAAPRRLNPQVSGTQQGKAVRPSGGGSAGSNPAGAPNLPLSTRETSTIMGSPILMCDRPINHAPDGQHDHNHPNQPRKPGRDLSLDLN